jgi:hypothetical protein
MLDLVKDAKKDEIVCDLIECREMWEALQAKARARLARERRAGLRIVKGGP